MKKKCSIQSCEYDVIIQEHHIVPLSMDGCECDENIALLCPNHHGYLTHPKRHPEIAEQLKTEIGEGRTYHDCEKCNERIKAMDEILEIVTNLIYIENPEELKKEQFKMFDLQMKYQIDMKEILHRRLGMGMGSLIESELTLSDEDQRDNFELTKEWVESRRNGSGNQDHQGKPSKANLQG